MTTATDTSLRLSEIDWIAERLKIATKEPGAPLQPLEPNREQLALLKAMAMQQAAGLPIRIIVLKARQVGVSTIVEAYFFARALFAPNVRALVCAHSDKSSQNIFEMTRRYYDELPESEKLPTDYSSRKEIVFSPPHRSRIEVQTAGRVELGRSETVHLLHASEVAFWPWPEQTLLSVLQCVPQRPGTAVVIESTANGMGGAFYDRWRQAKARLERNPQDLAGYLPIFFSWLEHEDYRRPVPPGYRWGPISRAEKDLEEMGATPEQLYWRRCMIEEYCGGDEDQFCQEYPATDEEAFRATGRPAIPRVIISHYRKIVRPGLRVNLVEDAQGEITAVPTDSPRNYWQVWHEPSEGRPYVVGADVAEGKLSDPENPRSGPDYSAAAVLNRRLLRIDAIWHGQTDPDLFGLELLKAGKWYNDAWIGPEVNSPGLAVLAVLKNAEYPFIYSRQQPRDYEMPTELAQLGWRTTLANRSVLFDDLIACMRPDSQGSFDGKLVCYAQRFVEELEALIRDKMGRRVHRPGHQDDLLFAVMIALQLHLLTPMPAPQAPDGYVRRPEYMYSGGRDPGIEPLLEKTGEYI